MNAIAGFFRFWYDFLIGDSWQIALGVVLVVTGACALIARAPDLAPAAGPFFLGALVAVFWGVLLRERGGG